MGEFECQADAAETGQGSSASPLQAGPGADALKNRVFHHNPEHGDFSAYHACEEWLRGLGCSIGSMQRGAPTAVMFSQDWLISKHRGLSKKEVWDTHGWITGTGGRFRGGDVSFTVAPAGQKLLAAIAQRQLEEPSGDEALLSNGGQPDTNKSEILP